MTDIDGGTAPGTPTTSTSVGTTEEILIDVEKQIQDVLGVAYPPDVLLPYLNLAIAAIVRLDPSAYPVPTDFTLVAGAKQTVDESVIKIMDVVCNLISGTVVGSSVTMLLRKQIDMLVPSWQTFTANNTVLNVIMDESDPYAFYVFPPQPSSPTQKLRMIFSELPSLITDADGDFPLEASYKLCCINYVLYLVLREETTIPNALNKANMCLGQFYRDMGIELPQDNKKQQNQQ